MTKFVSLYEAKTKLSSLVDEAASGEEIVISKNGKPQAKLVAVPKSDKPRKPAKVLKVDYMAPDFDAPDPDIQRLFEGD